MLLVTFTKLHQAGEVWQSSLLSERFCKAEIRETPHTARWMAKFYHLSSPGNPAAWHLGKEHMLWLKRTYRELQLMVQHSYLLDWDQIWACHKEIGQISLQALFFSLQLILLLEQLGENLLFCHSGLRDWRNLKEIVHGSVCADQWCWRKKRKSGDTCLVKSSLEFCNFIAIPFEQSPIIWHLCYVRVVLHFLCCACKLFQRSHSGWVKVFSSLCSQWFTCQSFS